VIPFTPFPKLSRLSREMVVTEKLDGTNAQVTITPEGEVLAGSRNRWVTPQDDNYGFARWVEANKAALLALGEGSHFGEWWGNGIQRRYGLAEKRFSLFNTGRWTSRLNTLGIEDSRCIEVPVCHVVPVLQTGPFTTEAVDFLLGELKARGSIAAPGFMQPEGVVVYHVASKTLFKKTLDKNDNHKEAV
jgi:hypothetical protein